mgnify:FL=1
MKKIIPILFVFFLLYGFINKEEILIPTDAIRFRVIANSNDPIDQELKMEVKNALEEELNKLMISAKNSQEAKQIIEENMDNIQNIVNNYTTDNKISFGMNYFPEKEYHGVNYESGNYESLVITLGNGIGNNWWCVMFPPLCLLEAKNENTDEINYKFYVQEIIEKYTS